MTNQDCPFCAASLVRHCENEAAFAIRDSFPVSPGHTLVIPRLHVSSIFDLAEKELGLLWKLVSQIRSDLIHDGADAINIGVNDGGAAGQTISHAHIHVIPRCDGDVEDPRGGVRWVIPSKAAYWE